MPNYNEKFNEVENLIRKLSDLVITLREDVLSTRNDITTLRDELLNIRGDITDLNVNKDATTTKAVTDIYKSIEELSWNVTYMMNLSGVGVIPPNMRFPQAAAANSVHFQQMYNTAYPMYSPMQFPPQGRASMPPQIPPNIQYHDQLGVNLAMGNYNGTPILPSPQQIPQQTPQIPLQQQQVTPQQPPQMTEKSSGPKSSLLEALNSPSVLNTWNNTFNNTNPNIPTSTMQVPPPQIPPVQPSTIQNKPVEKAAPVNVVITNSDPLPAQSSVVTQPPLSVTIPPQHIKNPEKIAQTHPVVMQEKIKEDNSKVKRIYFNLFICNFSKYINIFVI